ncbi:MAG TPA: methyltransferase domain-containing protein [Pyrinomonadaceae bacterium]|nr:methyltransferase domain-containing protein [Pyrinomonadaceae bacterium]
MDYDRTNMAAVYDQGRSHGPEVLDLWMGIISSVLENKPASILDLGCGTGRFSEALAAYFDAEVIGLDPSSKMLAQAEAKRIDSRVRYESGRGEAISLPDESVDLVFISMAFHHFEDSAQTARECFRVLHEQGTVFLRAGTCENIPLYPYVDFFPATRTILAKDLFSGEFMKDVFEKAGFQCVATKVVTQEIAPDISTYAEKLATRADSILVQLSDADFQAGLDAVRAQAASVNNEAVFEPIDVFVFRK